MRQKVFQNNFYQTLISQINELNDSQILKEYSKNKFEIPEKFMVETNLVIENPIELLLPDKNGDNDLRNAITVFETFGQLTPAEATDNKLWATLAHNECWDYMRKRWPVEMNTAKNKKEYIKQRYFISNVSTKNLLRHGISRLWWTVYLTYDESRMNPYELTEELFSMLDYTTHLLPDVQGRNRAFSKAILAFVINNKKIFANYKQARVRYLLRKLNYMAGYKIFSALNEKEITDILNSFINALSEINE